MDNLLPLYICNIETQIQCPDSTFPKPCCTVGLLFGMGLNPVPEVGRDSAKLNKSISIWIYFVDKQSKGVQMRDSIYFSLPTDTPLMHI